MASLNLTKHSYLQLREFNDRQVGGRLLNVIGNVLLPVKEAWFIIWTLGKTKTLIMNTKVGLIFKS